MKSKLNFLTVGIFLLMNLIFSLNEVFAQRTSRDKKIIEDSRAAISEFIKSDGLMKNLFNNAHAYVIFPSVGKGGLGIGGALGNGIVYRKGVIIGKATLTQLTIGFQAGGQAYREVIFFENESVLSNFIKNNIEFSAQASAIIVNEGASANVKFNNGVMVFTQTKGGLMYEVSIGGQKFSYKSF